MTAVFQISNGTTTLDFRNGSGYDLISWRPSVAAYKDGGVFVDNKMATGRKPVYRQFGNITESILFGIYGISQDETIDRLQALLTILDAAMSYWLPGSQQSSPFYIVARADRESNSRYAVIYKGDVSGFTDPYYESFNTGILVDGTPYNSGMSNLTMALEIGQWLSSPPGQSTAVSTSVVETFNSINYGNVTSTGVRSETTDGTYICNRGAASNISHIYRYDSSSGNFSSNLIAASPTLPYDLFPNPAGSGDIIYFGIQTSLTDAGPFCNLIFDIGTAAAGTHTLTWEYPATGPSWTTLTVRDNTSAFTATGINGVFWKQPVDDGWITTSINGVTAYWVRCRISALTSMSTVPRQQNRNIYTVGWSYVEVQDTASLGDLPSLLKIKATNKSDAGLTSTPDLYLNQLFVGLRSYSRGASFRPFINFSDSNDQNPLGITVAGFNNGQFSATSTGTASRRGLYSNNAFVFDYTRETWVDRFRITLDSTICNQYSGSYRAFVRANMFSTNDSLAASCSIRLKIQNGSGGSEILSRVGDLGYSQQATGLKGSWELIDLGQIQIATTTETMDSVIIGVQLRYNSTAVVSTSIYLHDLILMPVDEFAAYCIDTTANENSVIGRIGGIDRYLEVDSATDFRKSIVAPAKSSSTGYVSSFYKPIANNQAILNNNSRQRLWFLSARNYITTGTATSDAEELNDTATNFIKRGVQVGDLAYNITADVFATVTSVAATQLGVVFLDSSSSWSTGDSYYIITRNIVSDPYVSLLVQLYKNQRYLIFRGDN